MSLEELSFYEFPELYPEDYNKDERAAFVYGFRKAVELVGKKIKRMAHREDAYDESLLVAINPEELISEMEEEV